MIALALAGCAPCPAPADIPVHDAAGAPDDVLAAISAAVADFARWTDREALCVEQIDVMDAIDEPDGDVGGQYDWGTRHVQVEGDQLDPYRTTLHELCHALDRDEGLSEAHADLFPAEETPESALYADEAARIRETFAEACEDGALDRGLTEVLEEACGVALLSAAERFLLEQVWRGAPYTAPSLGDVAVSAGPTTPVGITTMPYLAALGGDATGLLLVEVDRTRSYGRWPEPTASYRPQLRHVSLPDGADGAPVVPDVPWSDDYAAAVYTDAGGDAPVVVFLNGRDHVRAFTAGDEGASLERLALPDGVGASGGALLDGVAWSVVPDADGHYRPHGVRLSDGGEVAAPDLSAWPGDLVIQDGAEGALLLWSYTDRVYVRLDVTTGEVRTIPGPTGWPTYGGTLDGDRVIFPLRQAWSDHQGSVNGFAVYDFATEAWSVAPEPCRTERIDRVVRAAGGVWGAAVRTASELTLTPLTVGEP